MALISTSGLHHVRLTVTDIERSRAFYTDVLGLDVAAESPGDASDPAVRADPDQLYGGVVFALGDVMLGLRPVAAPGDTFDADRVGLDHLSFTVSGTGDLAGVIERLDAAGIPHGEVKELADFGFAILSFSDPDGVHLELTAPM